MNEQNLIPASKRSLSEVRENGKKGGIASGAARQKKKALREVLNELLASNICSEADLALAEDFGATENVTQEHLVIMGLLRSAKDGNVSAVKQVLEMRNEEERLKIEKAKLKIEQEKLKLLKEEGSDTEALDKLDDILSRLGDSS